MPPNASIHASLLVQAADADRDGRIGLEDFKGLLLGASAAFASAGGDQGEEEAIKAEEEDEEEDGESNAGMEGRTNE